MAVNQSIEIYIDKLVLQDFSEHNRYQIAGAVEAELTKLFSDKGIPEFLHSSGNIPLIKASGFNINKQGNGETIGNKIAGSVYKGFKNEKHNS